MDAVSLKLARNYTNEKLNSLPSNAPTKAVSFDGGIYSVGSDVVNGQISVALKGRSLKNELNYNRETWEEWTAGNVTKDISGLTLLADGVSAASAYINIALKTSTKYGVLLEYVSKSTANKSLKFDPNNWIGGNNTAFIALGNKKVVFTTPSIIAQQKFQFFYDIDTAGGHCKVRDIRLFELPAGSDIESDFTNLTADQLSAKYQYIKGDSTKSTNCVTLESIGKNYFSTSVEDWEQGSINPETGIDFTATTRMRNKKYARVPALTPVILSKAPEYGISSFWEYDINKTFIKYTVSSTGITTTAQTAYIRSVVSRGDSTQVITPSADLVLVKPQLEKGSVTTEYEAYKNSTLTTPSDIVLRSLPNGVKDEVNVTSGVKTQRTKEYILQASDFESFSTSNENYDSVHTKTTLVSDITSKHNSTKSTDYLVPGYSHTSFENMNAPYQSAWTTTLRFKLSFPKGTYANAEEAYAAFAGLSLIYQLAQPIITKLPAQAPLQVFENGTVYVEPLGDPAETTLPTVELTVPIGSPNKFGVISHDYQAAALDWTLSSEEQKCFLLKVTNAGGSANIIAPDASGLTYTINNLSGQTITIKKSGGTGVAIDNTKTVTVMHDGTDYIKISEGV